MNIRAIDGSTVIVPLDPETCLLLASACQGASEDADDGAADTTDAQRLAGALYRALASTFEGYAMLGHALGLMHPQDYDKMNPGLLRREWGVLPTDRRAS